MQNKATWLRSTPDGYAVRVQFMPMNSAESDRCSRLLKNLKVDVVMVTTEGPMTVDLFFTDNPEVVKNEPLVTNDPALSIWAGREVPPAPPAAPGVSQTSPAATSMDHMKLVDKQLIDEHKADMAANAAAAGADQGQQELTDEQQAALNKPDPTDKPA